MISGDLRASSGCQAPAALLVLAALGDAFLELAVVSNWILIWPQAGFPLLSSLQTFAVDANYFHFAGFGRACSLGWIFLLPSTSFILGSQIF